MSSTTVSTGIQTESMPTSAAVESHSVNESSFTKNETEEEMPEEEIEFGCPHNVYEKITNIRSNATH